MLGRGASTRWLHWPDCTIANPTAPGALIGLVIPEYEANRYEKYETDNPDSDDKPFILVPDLAVEVVSPVLASSNAT